MFRFKMTGKKQISFRKNSHLTKILKTIFPMEFFNEICFMFTSMSMKMWFQIYLFNQTLCPLVITIALPVTNIFIKDSPNR